MLTTAPNLIDEAANSLWWAGKEMTSGMRAYLEAEQDKVNETFVPKQYWECKVCGGMTDDARIIEDEHGDPQYICPECIGDAIKAVNEVCEPIIAEYLQFVLEDLWRANR